MRRLAMCGLIVLAVGLVLAPSALASTGVRHAALGSRHAAAPAGADVLEPPPHADRAMAATAVRISRPRPCRGATWNTSTSTQSIWAYLAHRSRVLSA